LVRLRGREHAIRDWLVDTLPEVGGPALAIYEDKKMPKLIQREQLTEIVVISTTRAMLAFADTIIERAAGASRSRAIRVVHPTRAP
jgi:hypothetical protein